MKGRIRNFKEAYLMTYIDNTVPESIHSFPTKQYAVYITLLFTVVH